MAVFAVLFSLVFFPLILFVSGTILLSLKWREEDGKKRVQVVVLGDIGRSPRMQYHSHSLALQDFDVDIIGYGGSQLIPSLSKSAKVNVYYLPDIPERINRLPSLPRYISKVLFQTVTLFWTLIKKTKKPSNVLLQTPPAIPSQFVLILVSLLRGSKLIVDYHNYAYTIMALSLGENHILVKLTWIYERVMSFFVSARLCVSDAMRKDLRKNWGVNSYVMYDRPPNIFQVVSTAQKHELFLKLSQTIPIFKDNGNEKNVSRTGFSESTPTGTRLRDDRPFLLVSSTSWTEDEDFSILLKALEIYEEKAKDPGNNLPTIVCIITGKGPLKSYYEDLIKKKCFKQVNIITMWLSSEDYPVLLASADLGVCLHKSSSGLDLPMKIVDMFGCGLPVCAFRFECLHELLKDEHNGLAFDTHQQLAGQLQRLCSGFPSPNTSLNRFRDNLVSFHSLRWHHYWKLHVLPLVTGHL
ncbi:PREDICTED: chitobiosyldiphosphodolichol beta-mannosyltransferase-like [Amphimedon queenslandica]|uniref:Chitobiosyldiphosphodolichol beta-mannosyltransferase n=1 Tax=Amphimedon queenslandica TaxID=400682 RepID=A0A1X7TJW2_AMPQE|nr:PREDICTED: chitobiosyldiphosphodolichol beta-mannosyltransferase-like [Amphimedon queenslandica]|eukprot:XP_003390371.1 PREDICTED: chitobiosyldiphosphodolichol beta-mannosyltransferase-like [Amphimedon queenslandica]